MDGGTYEITTDEGIFCIDHRIHTPTEGMIYKDYPEDNNSNLIQDQQSIKNKILNALDTFNADFYIHSDDANLKDTIEKDLI